MQTIICLGSKACDLGEIYELRSEPCVIKLIDKGIEGDNCFSIAHQKSPEEYEKNTPQLTSFFSDITNEVLFVVSGADDVANCSLKILQQIKDKKINIVYITPRKEFLTNKQLMQERAIRSILQEYTRSGVFEKMIMFDSEEVENLMGETTMANFNPQFNLFIQKVLRHYFNLPVIEKIIDESVPPKEISRIITFGYYDLDSNQEKMCYNLSWIDDKAYNFYFSEQSMEDTKLLKEIRQKIKNKAVDNTRVSYTISKAATETEYCFVVYFSKMTNQ